MENEIEYVVRTVGEHGPPTEETCPHGAIMRLDGSTSLSPVYDYRIKWRPDTEWWPAPAPPTERAPKPEPEPRWGVTFSNGDPYVDLTVQAGKLRGDEAFRAADILNTYERDGIVVRPRHWSEAPDDKTSVLRWSNGAWGWSMGEYVRHMKSWWLPMPPAPEGVESDG